MPTRGLLCKTLISAIFFSSLRYCMLTLSSFTFENIHPAGNLQGKTHFFETAVLERIRNLWCRDRLCRQSICQSKRKAGKKKLLFRFSLFYLVSLTFGIYGTLLLPFMLLTTQAKKKHYSWVFYVRNCSLYRAADCLHACANYDLAKLRF